MLLCAIPAKIDRSADKTFHTIRLVFFVKNIYHSYAVTHLSKFFIYLNNHINTILNV